MSMEKQIIIYRESFVQSVAADIMTFVFLCGSFYANVHWIQSKLFAAIIVIMFMLKIIAFATGRKNQFTDKQKAIDFLNS